MVTMPGTLFYSLLPGPSRPRPVPLIFSADGGGEEFIGIIKNVDRSNLENIGNRYRNLIEKTSITLEGDSLGITVSIGATTARDDDSVASIIKRADQLMYTCKQQGRNCLASG